MTTPADWRQLIPQLRDPASIELTQRLVAFQREWLDSQAGQLEEISRLIDEQANKLGRGQAST